MTAASTTGETTFTTPTDRELVTTRVANAPRALVFDAHTKPEHVARWMLGPEGWSMPVCEIDARPGGQWHYAWRKEDGSEMEMRGVYREVTPPARLVTTESWGPEWPETVNTIEFGEADGRTTITTTVLFPSKEARDAALATGMRDGIRMSYDRLEALLQTLAA